ncbi:MAG: tRNA 2-thiouridine(34) synthase MnmA [Candidatus Margulisbacteria bacterium]|nr:tRNA 2-thiouridine(34) synthase MnmA [Candidatus Margulisiibacteriota bacterium]
MKKRVLVGMSGGVDSSVAAALLKKRGYDVIGITMQLLPTDSEKDSACCNLGSVNDAKRVASALGIPHYSINSRAPFQEKVIDHFVSQYLQGHTPNPCVECNRHIKFEELYAKAKDLDADYIATGHYCKKYYHPATGTYQLRRAKDPIKDQSYFLYMMQSEQLKSVLFPLGGYDKSEIREMARELKLVNADKEDSQEICFVTQKSYKTFIQEQADPEYLKPGDIVGLNGEKLGTHAGIYQYTIGQRRGINISGPDPLYVLKINAADNTVVVGPLEGLRHASLALKHVTLVNPSENVVGKEFGVKMRSQMAMVTGKVISCADGEARVELLSAQSFMPTGQSCVLYQGDRVVGGGVIY